MKKISCFFVVLSLFFSCYTLSAKEEAGREPNTLSAREQEEGFELLFDGKTIDKEIWQGDVRGYKVVDDLIRCNRGGNFLTKKEFGDFVFRFDFKLPPGGNNGVGIRTKLGANPAYDGHEVQILDDTADQYKSLEPYQYHGSIYRFVPAKRGSLRPVGDWNSMEILAFGNNIRVICNDQVIVETDMTDFIEGKKKCMDKDNPNHVFNKSGLIGFLGHNDPVEFRTIRVKEIKNEDEYQTLLGEK
ncbi:MAG: 3-keto-disaccharide hydrolase [Thermoguttaceae bacterium]